MTAERERLPPGGATAEPPTDPGLAAPGLAGDGTAFEGALFDAFAAVAARLPDHLAVDDGVESLSYAALRDRALALGARIAAAVPDDRLVGVLVETGVLYPVAWLACLAARRPFLPLDPHLPLARRQAIIAEAAPGGVIVPGGTAAGAAWLPDDLPRIPVVAESDVSPAPLPCGRGAARVGMVLFTSGSTGSPKGIALHERSLQRKAMNYQATIGLGPGERLLSLHPPATSAGARDAFGALLCGAGLCVMDLRRDGLVRALAWLRDGGVTVLATVPTVARALAALDGAGAAFRGVRIVRLGGEPIVGSDIATLARLLAPSARILVGFGMTEAGGALLQRLIDPRQPVEAGRIAVGTPAPGQFVRVEDADGNPVRPGDVGRLVIRGRYIALGHWVAGRLDPTEFPADPFLPGSRCFCSGDLMRLRADGMLEPVGRADRQVKINGVRIEPGEAEAALRGLPGVADAVVLVHGDAAAPVLVGFVVPAPGDPGRTPPGDPPARNTAQRARAWRAALAALLPPHAVPARIHVVPAIPLLPSLKPDLAALRALLTAEEAGGGFAGVWARLRGGRTRRRAAPARPRRDGAAP